MRLTSGMITTGTTDGATRLLLEGNEFCVAQH